MFVNISVNYVKEIITFWPIYELRNERQVPLFLTHTHTFVYKENLNEKEKKPHRKHLYDSLKMWHKRLRMK